MIFTYLMKMCAKWYKFVSTTTESVVTFLQTVFFVFVNTAIIPLSMYGGDFKDPNRVWYARYSSILFIAFFFIIALIPLEGMMVMVMDLMCKGSKAKKGIL